MAPSKNKMDRASRFSFGVLTAVLMVAGFAAGRALAPARRAPASEMVVQTPEGVSTEASDDATPQLHERSKAEPFPVAQSEEQIREALRRFGDRPSSRQNYEEILKLLLAWAATDPRAALDYALQHLKPPHQGDALKSLLSAWAGQSPAQAWAWVGANFPRDIDLVDTALSRIGANDPALSWSFASEYASQHPDAARSAYVGVLQGMIDAGTYQQAVSLVEATALSDGKSAIAGLVIGEWGRYDPAAAAAAALALPDTERGTALTSLAQSWSAASPQAAADFAAQLPVRDDRQAMLTATLRDWANAGTAGIGPWLAQYQQQPGYDQIVQAVVAAPGFMGNNVTQAISLANTLPDEVGRLQSLTNVFDDWMTRDGHSARNYLQSSPELSASTRAELMRRLNLAAP